MSPVLPHCHQLILGLKQTEQNQNHSPTFHKLTNRWEKAKGFKGHLSVLLKLYRHCQASIGFKTRIRLRWCFGTLFSFSLLYMSWWERCHVRTLHDLACMLSKWSVLNFACTPLPTLNTISWQLPTPSGPSIALEKPVAPRSYSQTRYSFPYNFAALIYNVGILI